MDELILEDILVRSYTSLCFICQLSSTVQAWPRNDLKKSVYNSSSDLQPLKRKFVRCSNQVTVDLLQKFIAKKLNLEAANQVGI